MSAEEKERKEIKLPRGQEWLINALDLKDNKGGICFAVAYIATMFRLATQADAKSPVTEQEPYKTFVDRLIFIGKGELDNLPEKRKAIQKKLTSAIAAIKLGAFLSMRADLEKQDLHLQVEWQIDLTKAEKPVLKAAISRLNTLLTEEIKILSQQSPALSPDAILEQAKQQALAQMKPPFSREIHERLLASSVLVKVHYTSPEAKEASPRIVPEPAQAALKAFHAQAQGAIEDYREKGLNDAERHLLNAPIFANTIEVLHSPERFDYLFRPLTDVKIEGKPASRVAVGWNVQGNLAGLDLVQSIASEAKGGMAEIAAFTGIYDIRDLTAYFKRLEACLRDITEPVALSLGSSDHRISVIYEPHLKRWRFINANNLTLAVDDHYCGDAATTAERVFSGFFAAGDQSVGFETRVYVSNTPQSSAIREAITRWQQSEAFKTLHQITPEKVTRIGANQITWLYIAAQKGHVDVVKALLTHPRTDPNQAEKSGATPLWIAAQNGHVDVVKALLAHPRTDPNQAQKSGATPLWIAARNGHVDVVKALLTHPRTDPNQAQESGATPLYIAAENGHVDVVKALLAHPRTDPNQAQKSGATPLYIAARNGHVDVVKALLAHPRTDPNQAEKSGATPLWIAAQDGHVDVVKALLAHPRTDPNQAQKSGATPLYIAARNGHVDVVKALLAHPRTDPNQAKKSGATPLWIAAQDGHVDVVKALLAHPRTDPNQAQKSGATPLYIAAQNGHVDVVKALLAHPRTDPNQAQESGATPLYIAAENGHVDVVKALLAHPRTDPNQAKKFGATPLWIAAYNGHVDVVKALLAHPRTDPNQAQESGATPLYIAAEKRHVDVIKVLLEAGVDPDKTLYLLSTSRTPTHIINLLKGYSAGRKKFQSFIAQLGVPDIERIDSIPIVAGVFKEELLSKKIVKELQSGYPEGAVLAFSCLAHFANYSPRTFSKDHLFQEVVVQLIRNQFKDTQVLRKIVSLYPTCVHLKDHAGLSALDYAAKESCSQAVFECLLSADKPKSEVKKAKAAPDSRKVPAGLPLGLTFLGKPLVTIDGSLSAADQQAVSPPARQGMD